MFSEHHTLEAELKALPGCQLLRSPSEREGLSTFTVVPQRRQQSRQCLDLPLALQSPAATKAEEYLIPGDPNDIETPTTELLEELPFEMVRNGGKGSDKSEHLSEVLQHLEKESQAWTDSESENLELIYEEDQCIHESLESLHGGLNNPEHLDSKMNNLELRDSKMNDLELRDSKMSNLELRDGWVCPSKPANTLSDRSPINPNTGLVEREEMEEHALVETEEETDWVEQYKERRRKFLNGDDGMKQFDVWGRIQRECSNLQEENTMQEMSFPSPPPPVYWDEKSGEYKEDIENRNEHEIQSCDDQWSNFDLSANSKPKYVPSMHSKPKAHSTQTNPNVYTSGAENNCNFTPEPLKTLKSHSSFDPCPPAAVSLFALAVFQKAKRSKPGLDPNCSKRWELPMHTQ